jgi:hypothetical protein
MLIQYNKHQPPKYTVLKFSTVATSCVTCIWLPHGGQKVISVTPFKNSIHYYNPVENARTLKLLHGKELRNTGLGWIVEVNLHFNIVRKHPGSQTNEYPI